MLLVKIQETVLVIGRRFDGAFKKMKSIVSYEVRRVKGNQNPYVFILSNRMRTTGSRSPRVTSL